MAWEPQVWAHGDWRLEFEPWSGWVRDVQWRGETVLIAIYCAVRGESWTTHAVKASNAGREADRITLSLQCLDAPFTWEAAITLGDDWLRYEIRGQAKSAFRTARTGLCILHPSGPRNCQVGHPGGRQESLVLPDFIQPHQPFTDVASLAWSAQNGAAVSLDFQGEVFETEDQRNWTDAALKTYCRRLIDAVPYTLGEGETVGQSVTLRCSGGSRKAEAVQEFSAPFPEIFLTARSSEDVRLLMQLGATGAVASEAAVLSEAVANGIPSDFCLASGTQGYLGPPPNPGGTVWLPFDSWSARVAEAVEDLAPARQEGWKIGVMTPQNFAELNRSRPDPALVDAVGYGVCPQVHAFDERSLLENAWAAGDTYASAERFARDRQILPFLRFAQGPDSRSGGEIALAYTLLAMASLAGAGCRRLVLTDALCSGQSQPLSKELGEVLRLKPKKMLVSRQGPITRLGFSGKAGRLDCSINSSPFEVEGRAGFSVRRES